MEMNTVLHVFRDSKPKVDDSPRSKGFKIDLGDAPKPFVPSVFKTRDGEPFQVEWLGYDRGSWIVFYNR